MLTDFGLAKIPSQTGYTASGATMGTLTYMAPELFQGMPGDHRADIYALGIVLYEILAGRLPCRAETQQALILMHLSAPLPSPRSVVPSLPDSPEQVILKSLAKSPEERL